MNNDPDADLSNSSPQTLTPKTELPVEVPPGALSDEVLDAVIESFVLREGTDYGLVEVGLEKKIQDVRRQLDQGDIKLVFDASSESVSFMTKARWLQLHRSNAK